MSGRNDLELLRAKALERPHGTRASYVVGCRCAECRRANREYAQKTEHDRRELGPNVLVSADQVRAHLQALRRQNVGFRAVADAAKVGRSALQEILAGTKSTLRARSAARVLAVKVDQAMDGARMSGAETRKLLLMLVEEGYTKCFLAKELGYSKSRVPQIAVGGRVTVRNAARVKRLHQRLMA